MPKLSDTQLVLLTAAAARPDGSLLPAPSSISAPASRLARSIPALIKRALVSEAPVVDPALAWRSDDDQPLGAFIADAGRAAIRVEPEAAVAADQSDDAAVGVPAEASSPAPPAKPGSKAALVLGLLTRADGATLAELVTATGWLPHTARAALTGLRKKGHLIKRGTRGEHSCYRIGAAA